VNEVYNRFFFGQKKLSWTLGMVLLADDALGRCCSNLLSGNGPGLFIVIPISFNFVVSGLFDLFPLIEVPVVSFGIPRLRPEFNHVRSGHLDAFPEVNVHFPVATVVRSIVEFELEGGSVPNVIVAFGNGEGVLWPTLHDPVALLFVSIPQHEAALLKAGADENDLLANGAIKSDIVGGSPVGAILSVPLAVDDKTLGKGENEGIRHTLGEAGEEVHAGMSFPAKCPGEIGVTVIAPAFASLAPMVLAVSGTVTITVGLDAFVVKGAKQVPLESHFLFGWAPVPVGINDGSLLMIPVIGIVLRRKVLKLPEVAVNHDAWLPELDVLVDVSGVSSTTFHLEGDDSVDIDLSVASLGGDPMRRVLANDLTLHDGAFGLEVIGDASDVSRPCSLGAADGVGGPDVGSILTPPVPGHMVWVLLARVHLVTTLHVAETVVGHAAPDPAAVIKGRTLASGTVDICNAIHAGRSTSRGNEITVKGAAHVPRVIQRRHDVGCFGSPA